MEGTHGAHQGQLLTHHRVTNVINPFSKSSISHPRATTAGWGSLFQQFFL